MRRRILIYSTIIILISVAVTAMVSVRYMLSDYLNEKEKTLGALCRSFAAEISHDIATGSERAMGDYASGFSEETGYRATLIDADGNVLADSEAGRYYVNMDNHRTRPEVDAALKNGSGGSERESETFNTEYLYVAHANRMPDGKMLVIRLSMTVDKGKIAGEHIAGTLLISGIIGVALAFIFALFYSRRLMRPVRRMEARLDKLMAENRRAENIRRDFVANVTHELKTPLTSIAGFVETLQGGAAEDPEIRRKFLDIISIESARLARLIDDILIISDIENGKEAVSDQDINVKKALEETIEALGPLAASNGVAIHLACAYEMYLGGDTGRFKQMMVNLIENAVKYSGEGKSVYVSAEKKNKVSASESEDDRIVIKVRDEGIGIAPEDIPRLFERFFRVDKSRSKSQGSTGLGLAIVKHIAALHDAEITVESRLGEGSTFTISFKT